MTFCSWVRVMFVRGRVMARPSPAQQAGRYDRAGGPPTQAHDASPAKAEALTLVCWINEKTFAEAV